MGKVHRLLACVVVAIIVAIHVVLSFFAEVRVPVLWVIHCTTMQVDSGCIGLNVCVMDIAALVEECVASARLVSVELVGSHSVWHKVSLRLEASVVKSVGSKYVLVWCSNGTSMVSEWHCSKRVRFHVHPNGCCLIRKTPESKLCRIDSSLTCWYSTVQRKHTRWRLLRNVLIVVDFMLSVWIMCCCQV